MQKCFVSVFGRKSYGKTVFSEELLEKIKLKPSNIPRKMTFNELDIFNKLK